nr:MAG: hypothetical protein 2 [Leviviridae sp.]
MFADPAALTINAVAKNLVKINQDGYSSEYLLRSTTDEFRLRIRNASRTEKASGIKIDRHNVELIQTVFGTAPAPNVTRKVYVVIENQQGDTLTDPTNVAVGLLSWLTASSAANITKLMNFES